MNKSPNLLEEALGLHDDSLPPSRVLLIEDCVETSGAFILHHLIKRSLSLSLSSSGVVLLISLAHPFSEYDRILRKQGCNLVTHRANGGFFFFDMLKLDCPDSYRGLCELYEKIQKTLGVTKRDITIVIDDISLMEVAAHGCINYVLDFLHYCQTLVSERGCSLVILNHDDIYSRTTVPSLILQLEYLADLVLKVEPLVTGLAADVHGQLTILNKRVFVDEQGILRSKIHNFHFKVKENSVDYFYPGSRN